MLLYHCRFEISNIIQIFYFSEAYLASESAGGADTPTNAPAAPEPNIPDELICSLCRDLLTDAVMIPCCGNSFCDECKWSDFEILSFATTTITLCFC